MPLGGYRGADTFTHNTHAHTQSCCSFFCW